MAPCFQPVAFDPAAAAPLTIALPPLYGPPFTID
jgi:hypothetical protein